MTALHQRLVTLDQQKVAYELDFVTMKNDFVYRHLRVLSHDEETLFATSEAFPELYIQTSEIATLKIVRQ